MRMTVLVDCCNKLDEYVGKLKTWVATRDSSAPKGGSKISMEKLESQLNTLKTMFAEKQKLVSDLDAYGPAAGNIPIPVIMLLFIFYLDTGSAPAPAAAAPAEEEAPAPAPAEETPAF